MVCFPLGLAAGCSAPARGQVTGSVKFKGKPVADVVVVFTSEGGSASKGARASGFTDAEGRFQLRAEDQRDGVEVGSYRIAIQDYAEYKAPRDAEGKVTVKPPVRFPPRFGDPAQTPLRREVVAGPQTVDLDLSAVK
jgi:hypothetical protein